MHSENNTFYHRVHIQGTLTTLSLLHIGSGELKEEILEEKESINYNALCQDAHGQPYLPAASLRGFLAEMGQTLKKESYHRIFGNSEPENQCTGALRIYDAPLISTGTLPQQSISDHTALRAYVALNPITGVAETHQLFHLEYVPANSIFSCHLELEAVNSALLADVLSLLKCWNGSGARSSLGSGTSKGRGRVKWALEQIKVLEDHHLQNWLLNPDQPLEQAYCKLSEPQPPIQKAPSTGQTIKFRLYPQSPFLVNDPAYVQPSEDDEASVPALEYSRMPDGRALIPATALRGWMRGRARRILLTLLVEKGLDWAKANAKVDALLVPLFGSTERQSPLWFDDAVSPNIAEPRSQMFNAVDRFTGGVAQGHLYQVRAADCEYLEGQCYSLPRVWPEQCYQALLLLVIRDALEGDLVLGWGKGRGYGAFQLEINLDKTKVRGWHALKGYLKNKHPEFLNLEALHKRLALEG